MRFPPIQRLIRSARRRHALLLAAAVAAFAVVNAVAFGLDDSGGHQDFTVTATPEARSVYVGRPTHYDVTVSRQNGFKGRVRLHVRNLGTGNTAAWRLSDGTESNILPSNLTEAKLTIWTSSASRLGPRVLTITGVGYPPPERAKVLHQVDVDLSVRTLFRISGSVADPLYPGVSAPLDLKLTNPRRFDVNVTNLSAEVARVDRAGCDPHDFSITQVPASAYPIPLEAGKSSTLHDLGLSEAQEPQVEMLDAPWNQDACKGARLGLRYRGTGTR